MTYGADFNPYRKAVARRELNPSALLGHIPPSLDDPPVISSPKPDAVSLRLRRLLRAVLCWQDEAGRPMSTEDVERARREALELLR